MFLICESTSDRREKKCSAKFYGNRHLDLSMDVELSSVGTTNFRVIISENVAIILKRSFELLFLWSCHFARIQVNCYRSFLGWGRRRWWGCWNGTDVRALFFYPYWGDFSNSGSRKKFNREITVVHDCNWYSVLIACSRLSISGSERKQRRITEGLQQARFWGPAATTLAPKRTFKWAILSMNGENRASWSHNPCCACMYKALWTRRNDVVWDEGNNDRWEHRPMWAFL